MRDFGRYVLAADIITPLGINADTSVALAKADLGRFSMHSSPDKLQRYSYTNIEFLQAEQPFERQCELVTMLLTSLLAKIPPSLKPLPLLLSVPEFIDISAMQKWLQQSEFDAWISHSTINHQGSSQLLSTAIASLEELDALVCVSVDSIVQNFTELLAQGKVLGSDNPWGLIPSEGGAGIILSKRVIIDALKLTPLARWQFQLVEKNVQDRRGMLRLVREASKLEAHMGPIYTDMTNQRMQTEDYGFAIAGRGECFTKPQQPFLSNDLWGTTGNGSGLGLIACAVDLHRSDEPVTLFMFDKNGDRSILQLKLSS